MKIVIVFIIILIVMMFIPFYIALNLNRKNENDNIYFSVKLFGIIIINYEIPLLDIICSREQVALKLAKKVEKRSIKKDITRDKAFIKLEDVIHTYRIFKKNKSFYQAMSNYILKKIEIKKISWIIRVGCDDAAITAIISGLFWSIISSIFSILLCRKHVKDCYIDVISEFSESVFEIDFYCIIKFKLVYIITAGYKGVKVKIKGGGLNV